MAQSALQHQDEDNQQSEFFPCGTSHDTSTQATMPLENTLQLHLAKEWVHQDRFNIQEAFTNQSKKLQEDLDVFLDQQETEFLKMRVKAQKVQSGVKSETKRTRSDKASSQFLSNVKRSMLLHTVGQDERNMSTHIESDIGDGEQDKLDELQRQLETCKEVAETKYKENMQWIGRQCVHLFAQLDSKETEAKVVAMMLQDELTQIGLLHHRLSVIVNALEDQCHQQSDRKDSELPRLRSVSSEKHLSLKARKNTRKQQIQVNKK
ncbi:hypothetical protein DVH05_023893 [Phytophthora capsici]|nr:hypothetical protein DVH05_023893 [Phytophthora capsici]